MNQPYPYMQIPQTSITLMKRIYTTMLPAIHQELSRWKARAEEIPSTELRKQALASITSKQFHCEGGGLYALLAHPNRNTHVLAFIVAYQTISDYLDNLCDRSVSLDAQNFRALHQAMQDALQPTNPTANYYQYQVDQEDGGYLQELVQTCQQALARLPMTNAVQQELLTLCHYYCDLQVHKHIQQEERENALLQWWGAYQKEYPQLNWYEFAAATGSTLGIFYLVSLASHEELCVAPRQVVESYFPFVQGLHILLDYLIDQQEDRLGGDLNFCFYYPSEQVKKERLLWFYDQAKKAVQSLPYAKFHSMITEGLIGIYLADVKVKEQKDVAAIAKCLVKQGTWVARFFYWNGWMIHRRGKKV